METTNSPLLESADKEPERSLEALSKDELLNKCKTLLAVAHKVKTAASLADTNNKIQQQQPSDERRIIAELQSENNRLKSELDRCVGELQANDALDSENVSYKRQISRLTDENEQLLTHLESLEKQVVELKTASVESPKQQCADDKKKLAELQNMLSISLKEVKKLQDDNAVVVDKVANLKINLTEKDRNIRTISEELKVKCDMIETLQSDLDKYKLLKDKLRFYHGKLIRFAGNVKSLKEDKNDILKLFKIHIDQVTNWKQQLNQVSEHLLEHIGRIELENSEITKENQLLKEHNANIIKQLEAHKTDDEKMNDIESIRNDNKKLTDDINSLLLGQEQYKKQIDELTATKEELESIIITVQNNNQCIQSDLDKYQELLRIEKENHQKELAELTQTTDFLQKQLEHSEVTEKRFADETSGEITKLVRENKTLIKANTELSEEISKKTNVMVNSGSDIQIQVSDCSGEVVDETVAALKRENIELLSEMNEMNQALKERGENVSKLQQHCDEIMKKLQIYETQANKNVDNISEKEVIIKCLQDEIETLKDKLLNNTNSDGFYAESEAMSTTSTISRTDDEVNRLKELEGSWEERYGKLRNLALKLKGKIRDLTAELNQEQHEKNDLQSKYTNSLKIVQSLQIQCDRTQDDLESNKNQSKQYLIQIESLTNESIRDKQLLATNQEIIMKLEKELDELSNDRSNTDTWKKQVASKIQMLRKEVDANKLLRKEFEIKITKLTNDLELKEQQCKNELDSHKQTKTAMDQLTNELKKKSVFNLEMEDYERSVKDLSQKLDKKQEQINQVTHQLESQKSTINALREQNKLLDERVQSEANDLSVASTEILAYKQKLDDLDRVLMEKDGKIQNLLEIVETSRAENEELSMELSKVIAEHQKVNLALKSDKDQIKNQNLSLQQNLRELNDTLKLKQDELTLIQDDYNTYKVRAQSVLRQNQNRDVGLEEKLSEEVATLKARIDLLNLSTDEYKLTIAQLTEENVKLSGDKKDASNKCDDLQNEFDALKSVHDQLVIKNQKMIVEHGETVRELRMHADTLAQCYRQQISEQEVRHNREIIELQSKLSAKVPTASSPDTALAPLLMPREEGEGSESIESIATNKINNNNNVHPIPLERLLAEVTDDRGGDRQQEEYGYFKKQVSEQDSKIVHLTALLADTEQDLAKHVQMNKLLKEEIRRQQRSVEREKHAENLEYLKNVVFKFITLHNGDERSRLVPVLNTILKLSPEESNKLILVAKGGGGDPSGIRGWANYLPTWPKHQ